MKQKTYKTVMEEADFTGFSENRGLALGIDNFHESFTSFINLLNDKNLSTHKFGALMEEAASTSDFPVLLGTVLDQQLLAQYKMIIPDWREYIAVGTSADFRPSQLAKLWGLEKPFGIVPEMGEYPEVNATEGKITIAVKKYGKSFGLTMEDLINDRLGAFSGAAVDLARAAQKTEYRFATGLYSTAAGPNPLLFGTALTHALDGSTVNNKGVLPFSADNLATVISLVRRQRDQDGEPLFFEKIHLVVPAALEIAAKQALSPASLIGFGGDSTAGSKGIVRPNANILNQLNITLHVNPYLDIIDTTAGAKTWYVFIDKADAAAVQVNFLRGYETPTVFMKASNQTAVNGGSAGMGESFEDDTLWWKVRHCLGGSTIDPRAAYASVAP